MQKIQRLLITGKTIQVLQDKFQNDLYNIVDWCPRNKMRINVMKTKVMLITTNRRTSMLPNKILEVKINEAFIENVTSHKLLGEIMDISLSWKQQIVACPISGMPKTYTSVHNSRISAYRNS